MSERFLNQLGVGIQYTMMVSPMPITPYLLTNFIEKVPHEIRVFRSKSGALGWILENTDQNRVESAEQG